MKKDMKNHTMSHKKGLMMTEDGGTNASKHAAAPLQRKSTTVLQQQMYRRESLAYSHNQSEIDMDADGADS